MFNGWETAWEALSSMDRSVLLNSIISNRKKCYLIYQFQDILLLPDRIRRFHVLYFREKWFLSVKCPYSQKQMSQAKILKHWGKWQFSPFLLPSAKMKSWLATGIFFLGIMPAQIFIFILLQLFSWFLQKWGLCNPAACACIFVTSTPLKSFEPIDKFQPIDLSKKIKFLQALWK